MEIDRDPMPFWEIKGSQIPVEGAYSDLLGSQVTESLAEFQRQLSRDLYGDEKPYIPPSRWQRVKNWLGDNRITNAWLVLIGCEDIDRGYY